MKTEERWHRLIANFQTEGISDEEMAELEEALETSPQARELFHRASRIDSLLALEAVEVASFANSKGGERSVLVPFSSPRKSFVQGVATAASIALLFAISWVVAAEYRIVGNLVSSENAIWERSAALGEDSQLRRGTLKLTSGIAKIRLKSGVNITLEAPAQLKIHGLRRGRLVFGTAIVKAAGPEGFLLETVYGQAVINEGEFIVFASPEKSRIDYELLSGEAIVSHDVSREAVKLSSGGVATLNADSLESSEASFGARPVEQFDRSVRVVSNVRSATFIRNDQPYRWTRPELLTLRKLTKDEGFNQYSVVAFNLDTVDADQIKGAVLRMSLVPSGAGLVSALPEQIRFAVYGLMNPMKEDWSNTDVWQDAPAPGDGELVGQFEIPRTQQSGTIEIEGALISAFVRGREGSSVSFIIVRETAELEGKRQGLTHALASESHPETAGPVLEVHLKD